jgi:hypothetical protein
MRMGTKSLLFGAHQIFWHPFTVFLAWLELYGWPNWKEMMCIFIHDWGYWGLDNMEGDEGKKHPHLGANLAWKYLDHKQVIFDDYGSSETIPTASIDKTYFYLCLFHSRTLADKHGMKPSKLCWADKLCVKYERWWIYLPRVFLSGEVHEYYQVALNAKLIEPGTSYIAWYNWARERMIRKAYAQDERPPYQVNS